jgi:hypothetical protein
MRGAVSPLPQHAFMAWCSVKKTQAQLYLYLYTVINPCKISRGIQKSSVNVSKMCSLLNGCVYPLPVNQLLLSYLQKLRPFPFKFWERSDCPWNECRMEWTHFRHVYILFFPLLVSQDSSVIIVDKVRHWGPPSLLSSAYRGQFPRGRTAGAWSYTSTHPHLHVVVLG